jgi:hypothetical protein
MATAAKQGFGGIIDMLGGPWGIAMGAAAVAIGIFVQKQVDAKKRSDDFSDAINDGTSAVVKLQQNIASGDNIDWGWWQKGQTGADSFSEALDKAGISSKTFAKAVAGNKDALAEYNAKMKELELGTSSQVTLGQKIAGVYNQEKKAMDQSKIAAKEKAEADAEATAEKNKNTYALAGNTDALNANGDAATEVASADDLLKDRTGGVTDAVTDTASAIKAVVDSLKDYYGFAESADKAEDSLAKSFDAATESINKNGNTANESKTALNNNSDAARANKDALYGIVDAAMDTASAYAAAGKSTGEIKDKTQDARDHFIDAAQQMGLSAEAANQLADSYGLIPDEVATQVLANTDPASAALTQIGVQVEHMPDGTVQISGDNKDAIDIIAATNGLTVDPKTGTVTMDKNQYDVALALANGATIDPKTGKLLGDNSDHWKKVAEANGWKINKKTGVISGNDGPFKATKADVDQTTIAGKTVKVGGDASEFWGTINGILSQKFSVNVKTKAGGATGGYFDGHMFNPGFASGGSVSGLLRGPGTGTSDSIHLSNANVANGEYVIRAAAVNQYGVPFLDAVNNQRYAAEPVSKYMPANLTAYAQPVNYVQNVTINQYTTGSKSVDTSIIVSKIRAQTNTLLQGRSL